MQSLAEQSVEADIQSVPSGLTFQNKLASPYSSTLKESQLHESNYVHHFILETEMVCQSYLFFFIMIIR